MYKRRLLYVLLLRLTPYFPGCFVGDCRQACLVFLTIEDAASCGALALRQRRDGLCRLLLLRVPSPAVLDGCA